MTDPSNYTAKPSAWSKTKLGGKAAFDKGWAAFEKLGGPVNKLTNKIGSEAFWPTGMDKECEKAARILKSFCKDGFMAEQQKDASQDSATKKKVQDGPSKPPKVLVKIPQKVIKNCVGLAIYTTMRSGLWVSGAGGSGVLIAKNENGQWSPPSGILVHTLGVGFMAGIDIYDCVIVINDRKALEAFSKLRVSLGGEISVVAGPVGSGAILESELLKSRKPLFSYMKSRGLYAGAQVDGTIIIERNDENARYYGKKLPVARILQGNVPSLPPTAELLMEVVKDAEGRPNLNQSVLQQVYDKPAPADVEIVNSGEASEDEKKKFGNPNTAEGYAMQQQLHGHQQQQYSGYTQGNDSYYPPPPLGPPPQQDQAQNPPAYSQNPSDFPQQQESGVTEHGYYAPEKPPRPT
ncbi:uncharacterized protein EAF01_007485 [Botrytis porri]|uniref:Ysc84 actin-binding domain-containing protein n=1 Tax=Botrytis porri TaxID=87229 RepID=A0A4Z1KPP1_9HELO|nr:uncharacterized protein EAF01_007485 [Botrytis porri]KAF7902187.1 hypothetical protein EAF01_007485 [Botrytis porri]TGO83409.1 hypothetical protein BPOR_0653g00100 [Botrytis porri]